MVGATRVTRGSGLERKLRLVDHKHFGLLRSAWRRSLRETNLTPTAHVDQVTARIWNMNGCDTTGVVLLTHRFNVALRSVAVPLGNGIVVPTLKNRGPEGVQMECLGITNKELESMVWDRLTWSMDRPFLSVATTTPTK